MTQTTPTTRFKPSLLGKLLGFWLIGFTTLVFFSSVAYAADGAVAPTETSVFSIDLGVWTMLQALVVPVIVGLATNVLASKKLKVFANVFTNAIGALVASFVVTDAAVISKATLFTWILTSLASALAHTTFWKPLEVTSDDPTKNKLLPNVGFGGE